MASFNEDQSKYKCCCGCCRSSTGTAIICLIDGVTLAAWFFTLLGFTKYAFNKGIWYLLLLAFLLVLYFCFSLVSSCCGLIGVCYGSAKLVFVKMLGQMINVVVSFAGVIACIIYLTGGKETAKKLMLDVIGDLIDGEVSEDSEQGQELTYFTTMIIIVALLLAIIVFFIEIWFATIVFACFTYAKDKESHSEVNALELRAQRYTQKTTTTTSGLMEGGPPNDP